MTTPERTPFASRGIMLVARLLDTTIHQLAIHQRAHPSTCPSINVPIHQARRTHFDNCVSQHLSGAGSSPAGSVGRDLNLQKLNYQCLTTSVVVVLVVR